MFKFNADGIVTEKDVSLWNLESYNSRTKYAWPYTKGGASLPPRTQSGDYIGILPKGTKIEFKELLFDNSTSAKNNNQKYQVYKVKGVLEDKKESEGFAYSIYAGKVQIEEEIGVFSNPFKKIKETAAATKKAIDEEAEKIKKNIENNLEKLRKETGFDLEKFNKRIKKFVVPAKGQDVRLQNFLEEMEKKVGEPYYLGGGQMDSYKNRSNKNLLGNWKGFDCCGGIMHSISEVTGATVPGGLTAGGMYSAPWLETVDEDKTEPGDLVFFYNETYKEWRHVATVTGYRITDNGDTEHLMISTTGPDPEFPVSDKPRGYTARDLIAEKYSRNIYKELAFKRISFDKYEEMYKK